MNNTQKMINQDIRYFKKYLHNLDGDIIETQESLIRELPNKDNQSAITLYKNLITFYFSEKKNVQKEIIKLRLEKNRNLLH